MELDIRAVMTQIDIWTILRWGGVGIMGSVWWVLLVLVATLGKCRYGRMVRY